MPPSVDLSRATQGGWVDAAIYEMASRRDSPAQARQVRDLRQSTRTTMVCFVITVLLSVRVPPTPDTACVGHPRSLTAQQGARMGKVFERIVPAPTAFLRWLIANAEQMQCVHINPGRNDWDT